jgi:hypothetical protein
MKIVGKILGFVFGMFFVAGGALIYNETGLPVLRDWQEMRTWQPNQARLKDVQGFETFTEAIYEYEVSGHTYTGTRVGVGLIKDNIGSYHADMFVKLSEFQKFDRPVTIWHDPENPQNSVIDREMRWGLFALMTAFCSIFILVGGTVSYFSIFISDKEPSSRPTYTELKREWEQQASDPDYHESYLDFVLRHRMEENSATNKPDTQRFKGDTPWKQNKLWQSPRIASGAKKSMALTWLFTIFWIGVTTPVIFSLDEEISRGNYAVLIALIFPMVGIVLLVKATLATFEWIQFGRLEVLLDPFPGSIGGHVGGYLEIGKSKLINCDFKVSLECVYSFISGSGKNRSRSENIRWSEMGVGESLSTGRGVRISFRFNVPDDLPESNVVQENAYTFWRLRIQGDVPGVNLDRIYNIPVFKTAIQSRNISHDISQQVQENKQATRLKTQSAIDQGNLEGTPLAESLELRQVGDTTSLYFPIFRNRVLTIISMITAATFGAAPFAILTEFSDGGMVSVVLVTFILPFLLISVFATVCTIYLPFNSLSITITSGNLTAVRRLFGVPISKRFIPTDDITGMDTVNSGSMGQGTKRVEYFKIVCRSRTHKDITVAESIEGRELCDYLASYLTKNLG